MQQLEHDIHKWANERFPDRTLASRLRKLGEEFGELAEAVCNVPNYPHSELCHTAAFEAADCAIVLSDICSMLGYSLSGVMTAKFTEVQKR